MFPSHDQGFRNDIHGVKKYIDEGHTLKEVSQEYFEEFIRYHAGFTKYYTLNTEVPHRSELDVVLILGNPGLGKSYMINNLYPNAFRRTASMDNWLGYEGQRTLVLDDFQGNLPVVELLQVLDHYPHELRVLYSFCYARWERVIIISNVHPRNRS